MERTIELKTAIEAPETRDCAAATPHIQSYLTASGPTFIALKTEIGAAETEIEAPETEIEAPETSDWVAATPYIHRYLTASGLTPVDDAYPFPAWERWFGCRRYYLLSARRAQIDSLSHPVDIDVLAPITPAYRRTRNLCRGIPLSEAVTLFLNDTLKHGTDAACPHDPSCC